jgi:hypothetical protein
MGQTFVLPEGARNGKEFSVTMLGAVERSENFQSTVSAQPIR